MNTSTELAQMAAQQFDLVASEELWDATKLRNTLAVRISWLLDHRFEELLGVLYRVDVREGDAKLILGFAPKDEIPILLANLILDKLREKLVYRKMYPPEIQGDW